MGNGRSRENKNSCYSRHVGQETGCEKKRRHTGRKIIMHKSPFMPPKCVCYGMTQEVVVIVMRHARPCLLFRGKEKKREPIFFSGKEKAKTKTTA